MAFQGDIVSIRATFALVSLLWVGGAIPLTPLTPQIRESAPRPQLVISLAERELFVLGVADTLVRMPIGVGAGVTFSFGDRSWRFRTPRGERRVRRKVTDPVWVPPDWHYAETAQNHGLRLTRLPPGGTTLRSGWRLVMRDNVVGVIIPHEGFEPLPLDEHIVFDGRLFIPPLGSRNRQIRQHLGLYALDLGDGYMIHGTSDTASIGKASTHGCIRVGDDHLLWLYENVPVGTRVLIQ